MTQLDNNVVRRILLRLVFHSKMSQLQRLFVLTYLATQLCFTTNASPVHTDTSDISDNKNLGGNGIFSSPSNNTQKSYWESIAFETLRQKIKQQKKGKTETAKNIIFFLGDGMSITTITAARIYQGQLKNKSGEEETLSFESFPITGLAKTYCVDSQVSDSACTATALMSGVKTNIKSLGVTADVTKNDCKAAKNPDNQVSSLIKWAQDAGKATGIITNTRITHATPAAAYAHVPTRSMESDADVILYKLDPTHCDYDIAGQLILDDPGRNIKVIMGGGRSKFIPKDEKDPISGFGERLDGVDLIEKWREDKLSNKNASAAVVYTVRELRKVDTKNTEYLLGLFNSNNMKYHMDADPNIEPELSLMTMKAIDILQNEKNGFVLFVEGGEIDYAHHNNLAQIALDETIEFAKAVQVAVDMTDEKDTLIVVTADHSHTMTMNGYPTRGSNILEFGGKDRDNISYSILSYANGPSYHENINGKRYNITNDNIKDKKYMYPAMIPMEIETHGGDDVAVFARGPCAHLFSGSYEQNYIPIAEGAAADIGPIQKVPSSASTIIYDSSLILILIIINSIYGVTI